MKAYLEIVELEDVVTVSTGGGCDMDGAPACARQGCFTDKALDGCSTGD
ncbi:MAG: hypothetical protein MJ080_04590 [Clostridia bacterium]|nr:hypothetical protein [Clostridia bacterium]